MGRDRGPVTEGNRREVSIHAPAWGATAVALLEFLIMLFQSTRPHGARLRGIESRPSSRAFQSTRPHGARPRSCSRNFFESMFQSTRPHGARRYRALQIQRVLSVSIHAPAWGATYKSGLSGRASSVSIHAPAWGATNRKARGLPYKSCFNPRARMGRDDSYSPRRPIQFPVSIHAPAWGATVCTCCWV